MSALQQAGPQFSNSSEGRFPFWDLAIAPIFDAIGARRIVEIDALRGETTVLMLDRLGPDAELHVIDPVPEFDPAEHEAMFPGRYVAPGVLRLSRVRCGPSMRCSATSAG